MIGHRRRARQNWLLRQLAGEAAPLENQLPGVVVFIDPVSNLMTADDYSPDGADGFNRLNGQACFKSADSFMEKEFTASAGVLNLTIYGKHSAEWGSSNNALRIYLNGDLQGTHALFDNGSDVTVGTTGGYASPTTFALTVTVPGPNVLRLRGPDGAQPDRIGVSRVTAP